MLDLSSKDRSFTLQFTLELSSCTVSSPIGVFDTQTIQRSKQANFG